MDDAPYTEHRTCYAYPTSPLAEAHGGPSWYVLTTIIQSNVVDRPDAGPFDAPEDAYDAMKAMPGVVSMWSHRRDGSYGEDEEAPDT